MATKIKPTQPTVIKDKKIIAQVIAEIHRQPTKEDLEYREERRKALKRALAE